MRCSRGCCASVTASGHFWDLSFIIARPVRLFRHIRFLCSWWNIKWIISFSHFIFSLMSGVVVKCQSVHHCSPDWNITVTSWIDRNTCRQSWFYSEDSHWLIICGMKLKEIRCLVVLFTSGSRSVWHQQWCGAVWTEVVKRKLRLKAKLRFMLIFSVWDQLWSAGSDRKRWDCGQKRPN